MNAVVKINAHFPTKFKPLLETKARYKFFYGGRGGTKSWQMARALLIEGLKGGLRVLCLRETQTSLEESSLQLLKDQIRLLGIGPIAEGGSGHYRCMSNSIIGPDGTRFIFKGLNDPTAIKSLEGCDRCWLEEATKTSKTAWQTLDPTVRKSGSQIWVSMNPDLATDYLYDLFVKQVPPPGSIVIKVTWRDNPWLSDELRTQKDHMRATNYDDYLWVWEGHCKVALEGAVYAKELRSSQQSGRICQFPMLVGKPIHTFWDLGRADKTAIWFAQLFGLEHRIIRYYEANGEHISHFIELLERLKEEEHYTFGTVWLPHDAEQKRLSSRRTTRQQMEDAEFKVKIVPKISVAEGIQAARGIFPNCYFNEQYALDGVDQLRLYHYDVDQKTGIRSKNPVHDDSSNGADAFRYMGVALTETVVKTKAKPKPGPAISSGRYSWMGR